MNLPKRKPNRLAGYDYSTPGAYFVTISTRDKRKTLSCISVGAIRESPLQKRALLPQIVGYLKMNTSKRIHTQTSAADPIFQRSYHDHIIRGDADYDKIARYIAENPVRWQEDCFYEP